MPSGPKTNKYLNRHSEEARKRGEERLHESRQAKEIAAEDAKWKDTDAKASKRLEKQREAERKMEEKALREAEKREQLAKEESEYQKGKPPAHVQKRELQKILSKALSAYDKERDSVRGSIPENKTSATYDANVTELPKRNENRQVKVEPSVDPNTITSHGTIDAALRNLNTQQQAIPENRHIGKRAKTLYKTFYEEQLEKVKMERPGLRRTQYNDIIWEMWQKSPLNPFVLRSEARDQARLEADRKWMEGGSSNEDDEESIENK
ncbi:unnamed protein product [Phytomonas sp. EM1]|nr:unnamed protein product [Phytomonas sp. EM1]|eukprot:CCW61894.1 unnamed protein product [Phytomonas sp. isolate EM1]